ncbi:MAG TPA: 30S ribosomal protein S18 [bacterium]|nr:30S ribosomal protein S18 [bacterium]
MNKEQTNNNEQISKDELRSLNVSYFDYKNTELLKKFTSYYGKIEPASRTGLNRKEQSKLTRAIKRARFLALMPYYTQ